MYYRYFVKTAEEAQRIAREQGFRHFTAYAKCQRCGDPTYAAGGYGAHQRDVDYCAHCDGVLAAKHQIVRF